MSHTIYHYTASGTFSLAANTLCGAEGNPPGGYYNCVSTANITEDYLAQWERGERGGGNICLACASIRHLKTLGEVIL
jgi:hypothetical protein